MTTVFLLALLLLPQAGGSPQPLTEPSAAPSAGPSTAPLKAPVAEDPVITKRAKDWFHRMQTGNVDRSQLDDRMNAALTDDVIKQSAQKLGPLGDPANFSYVKAVAVGQTIAYYYHVTTPTADFYWLFGVDPDGKISGFYLRAQLPD